MGDMTSLPAKTPCNKSYRPLIRQELSQFPVTDVSTASLADGNIIPPTISNSTIAPIPATISPLFQPFGSYSKTIPPPPPNPPAPIPPNPDPMPAPRPSP